MVGIIGVMCLTGAFSTGLCWVFGSKPKWKSLLLIIVLCLNTATLCFYAESKVELGRVDTQTIYVSEFSVGQDRITLDNHLKLVVQRDVYPWWSFRAISGMGKRRGQVIE